MSVMSTLDRVCEDVYVKAASALRAGEEVEDISEAIFEQVYNASGRTAESRDFAMSTANGITARLIAEQEQAEQLALRAPELRAQLAIALDLMFDYQEIEKTYPEELKRIEDLLRETE